VQQGCIAAPHEPHVPLLHVSPPVHVLPVQHGAPAPPHATHTPSRHEEPLAQLIPPQHRWPGIPHAVHVCVASQLVVLLVHCGDPAQHA
jgi:hypothetical protein